MIKTLLESISMFPESVQSLLLFSWGVLVFIAPIYATLKILQSRTFKSVYKEIIPFFDKLSKLVKHSINDPLLKFPRTLKALGYINVFNSYVMALILFVLFLAFIMMLGFGRENLTFAQFMGTLGFSAVCVYASAVIKTQASRELLKLRDES